MGPARALRQLPFVLEQVPEVVVAPLRRRRRPGHFQGTGDRVGPHSGAYLALPAETLLRQGCSLRLGTDHRRIAHPVALAEGVSAGDQRDRLFVVHRHAGEGLANVDGRRHRVRVGIRALRVHVDQSHLDGGKRILQVPVAGVTLVSEPGVLGAPVDVELRLPDVLAASCEPEGLESHRLEGDVAGENHQVGPGDLTAVLLLDRPEQTSRLVEIHVVGPAVQGCETLATGPTAAPTVADPVRAGAVPGHTNEQRTVVPEIGRPPVLRIGHQRMQVGLEGFVVEALEFLRVVEFLTHRIGLGGMLPEDVQTQLVRPPVPNGRSPSSRMREWAPARIAHDYNPCPVSGKNHLNRDMFAGRDSTGKRRPAPEVRNDKVDHSSIDS